MSGKRFRCVISFILALCVGVLFSSCSGNAGAKAPTSAQHLTNFCNSIQNLQDKYKSGSVSASNITKAYSDVSALQDELKKNPGLRKDKTFVQEIAKAYTQLKSMNLSKDGLKLDGDVKGTFDKLMTATSSLCTTMGIDTKQLDANVAAAVSAASTSSAPAASSAPATSQAPAAGGSTGGSAGGSTGGSTRTGGGSGGSTRTGGGSGGSTHTGGGTGGGSTHTGGGTGGGTTGGGTGGYTPAPAGISTRAYGADYGAEDQSQYNTIWGDACGVTSWSRYQQAYSYNKANPSDFEANYGVAYSDELNKAASIAGCFPRRGGSMSTGDAYKAYTGQGTACGDVAKAIEAAMHANGIPCKLVWGTWNGTPHMWVKYCVNGCWYEQNTNISQGAPSGCSVSGSGYNYG